MMRKMKFIGLFTLMIVFNFCNKNESVHNTKIYGDWYAYVVNTSNEGRIKDYSEVLFTESRLYRFSNIGGLYTPLYYKISNDSLFFYTEKRHKLKVEDYIGNVNFKGRDTLYIINGIDSLKFYRILNKGNLMSDYIKSDETSFNEFEKSHNNFLNPFFKRADNIGNVPN